MRPAGFGDDDRFVQDQLQQHKPSAAAVLGSAWTAMTRGDFKAGEGGGHDGAAAAPAPAAAGAAAAAFASQQPPQPAAVRSTLPLAPPHPPTGGGLGLGVRRGSHSALNAAADPPSAPALSMAAFTAAPSGGNAASQRSIGRGSGDSIGRSSSLRTGGRTGSDPPAPRGAGFSLAAFTQGNDPHAEAAAAAANAANLAPERESSSSGSGGIAGVTSPLGVGGAKAGVAAAAKGWSTRTFTSVMAKVGKGLVE